MTEPSTDPTTAKAVGVVLSGDWDASIAVVPEIEELGYSTLWLSGPHLDSLDRVLEVARATTRITISTAVIAVDQHSVESVTQTYRAAEAAHPGRFIPGLGGAHGARPLGTLGGYLDRLDTAESPIPSHARLLSALGPRMLDLAADRAGGAVPVLATPDYTAQARDRLGPDKSLIIEQFVAVDTDRAHARDAARAMVGFLRDIEGGYTRHFTRMGFTEDDINQLSDRLIDALVATGDLDSIARRVREHHAAGADQVALLVIPTDGEPAPAQQWRRLGQALLT